MSEYHEFTDEDGDAYLARDDGMGLIWFTQDEKASLYFRKTDAAKIIAIITEAAK